jgi:hypothetical protein
VSNRGDEVRWPAGSWISPSALNTFSICPHKVRLQYIEKAQKRPRFSIDLTKGRITHSILAYAANVVRRGFEPPDEEWIEREARRRLPFDEFPSEEERLRHVTDIVQWVTYGLAHLDREAEIINVEKGQHTVWPMILPHQEYTVMTRPDVVLVRTGDDGEPFVEIIDYKTGLGDPVAMVPVMTRLIFREFLAAHVPLDVARVLFTYVWLEKREVQQVDLTRDVCSDQWPGIKGKIRELVTETGWQPRPSRYCHYCDYRGSACRFGLPAGED